ncbi:site-specific integrase [Pseudovibrio denitrificans]|uniref:site-specific integrase n=1 Tax=Pseudovibrio denitrificans TaxID=258256 RepID=UPI0039BEF55E
MWQLLFTGCRLGKVLSLSRGQVEFTQKRLRFDEHRHGFVFPGDGKQGHIINLRKPWLCVLKETELTNIRIHDLRHTFASAAANQGVSLKAIRKLLGHASIQSTQRYAKLSNAHLAEQSEKIFAD